MTALRVISLLVPSRGRPDNIARLIASLSDTADPADWELIVRLDLDDPTIANYPEHHNVRYLVADRDVLSCLWNDCYAVAKGDICWHGGDDVIFSTEGWVDIVRSLVPDDGIAFIHGNDLGDRGSTFGTHGFLPRAWTETVGYFCPPYFSADYNDQWFNDIANILARRFYYSFVTEHLHPGHGKAETDATYEDTTARGQRDKPNLLYASLDMVQRRVEDVTKLWERMR